MPAEIKKVVIFGSTGYTGVAAVDSAIKAGFEVTAFVRDPEKMPKELKPHRVIQGNVLEMEDVDKAVEGQDAVIIALGTRNDLSPTTVMSDGTKNILEAMKKHGVVRVTCCLSAFLYWDRAKVPERFIPVTEDHERMLQILKESDREWIALCPPHIADEPARGDYELANDEPVNHVISKYDLGDIIVKCLQAHDHVGHTVGMGYPETQQAE